MTPSSPFDEFERFIERMQRQFEETADRLDSEPFGGALPTTSSVKVDLADQGEEFVLTADLPGFEKDDIDVTIADRTLQIQAERESATEDETDTYIRRERQEQQVSRTVRLPEAVDEDAISATYTNGVLSVTLPKRVPGDEGTSIDVE